MSLLVHLDGTIKRETPPLDGFIMGINYGLNKVRFINPVNVNSRIRASSVLSDVTLKGSAIDQIRTITIEIEGKEKPAAVIESIIRMVFDS